MWDNYYNTTAVTNTKHILGDDAQKISPADSFRILRISCSALARANAKKA